jgi:hypothetical protein
MVRGLIEEAVMTAITSMTVRVLAIAFSTAALVWLWLKAPQVIVAGFDMNLAVIKELASLVPAPYGAMGEVALRGLGADRALMFAEGTLLMRSILRLVARKPFWPRLAASGARKSARMPAA